MSVLKPTNITDYSATAQGDAICIKDLTHYYPKLKKSRRDKKEKQPTDNLVLGRAALDRVSFSIKQGEVFAILGPNGGGKTTLFRILSTMLKPNSSPSLDNGNTNRRADENSTVASVFGLDCITDSDLVRRQFGIVFQSPSLDGKLTAGENLTHQGHLYGLYGKQLKEKIDYWLDTFGLLDRKHSFVEHFSGGMRRRVEIAKALLHEPKLLLMDEPATGLDPVARRDMWAQLKKLRDTRGLTIVFTTHLMQEAESCDRLAILSQGKLIALDTPQNLKAKIGGEVVVITPDMNEKDNTPVELASLIKTEFAPWDKDAKPQVSGNTVRFEKSRATQVVADISSKWPSKIKSVTVGQPTLEDVFLRLTGNSLIQIEKEQ